VAGLRIGTIDETCSPPCSPGHVGRWLDWKRLRQASSRWYHQRKRLAYHTQNALVS